MNRVVHVIGNGDQSVHYMSEKRTGMKLLCNMPPFAIPRDEVYATCMVDFKMMKSLSEGHVNLDMYPWVLGTRPKIWMEDPSQSSFYLKYAPLIKEFNLIVPDYCGEPGSPQAATNFNCGHMAVHYACNRHKATEVHMYGFDTLFEFNMRSVTDLYLYSDRTDTNNFRLISNWRPIWHNMFAEFPNTKFVFHHNHDDIKIPKQKNMEFVVYKSKKTIIQEKKKLEKEEEILKKLNRKQRREYESKKRKGLV